MFNLVPKWPFVAGALVLGLLGGAYADHTVMQGRADKLAKTHAEELAARDAQRTRDEVAAREEERRLVLKASEIERTKNEEIATVRAAGAAAVASLRNRQDRKPAPAGDVPPPRPACQGATGAELSRSDGQFLVGEAARANELRAALGACYKAYDAAAIKSE